MDRPGRAWRRGRALGLPPATSCQLSGLSGQPSLMPPREFLWLQTPPGDHLRRPRKLTSWMGLEKWPWPGHSRLGLSVQRVCESENNSDRLHASLPRGSGSKGGGAAWSQVPLLPRVIEMYPASDLEPQSRPRPTRGSPPADPTPALQARPTGPPTACGPGSPFGRSCRAGPARPRRPGPAKPRQAGLPAALTTVLTANANISAAGPRAHSPPPGKVRAAVAAVAGSR